ncbi:reverse transcriptase domain-containing protein [Ectobacillus funiculus]
MIDLDLFFGGLQGGILSPLLSNIVLHDLDKWVSTQWELFDTRHQYYHASNKYAALRNTRLKEGFIVRYADDFKILCRDRKRAQRWYYAVQLYLKDRLGLDINREKSKIINLRKRKANFLGFTIKAEIKGAKYVAHTGIKDSKKQQIKRKGRELIRNIRSSPTAKNALLFNLFVLGLHNYFKKATHVNIEFSRIAYDLSRTMYNRLKPIACRGKPHNSSPSYKKFYSETYTTYKVAEVWLYPLADVRTHNNMNFSQNLTPFTIQGRIEMYRALKPSIGTEIQKMIANGKEEKYGIEFFDNRISRYSMVDGKCEVTGIFLPAETVHCHHVKPFHVSNDNSYSNLRIVHEWVHILIHATKEQTIQKYMEVLQLDDKSFKKLNQLRKHCGLELINKKIN